MGGGDAGDVAAVRSGGEADVDEVGLLADPVAAQRVHRDVLADLHHEVLALGDVRGRVVRAEAADLVAVLVRLHRGVVGEVAVVVDVDGDRAGGRVVEHAPVVGGVAVAVDVTVGVAVRGAALRGDGLAEGTDPVRALGRLPALAAEREGRPGDGGGHRPPGAVTVDDRIGGGHPVDDLALTGRRLLQRRAREVDTGVQDTDGHAAAVGLRVLLHEVDRARLEGRVVRVLRGGVLAGAGVGGRGGTRPAAAVEARLLQGYLVAQVDGLHGGEPGGGSDGRVRLAGRHGGPHVTELVVRTADGAALDRVQLLGDLLGLPGCRGDHHRDRLVALRLGLGEEIGVVRTELVMGGLDARVGHGGGGAVRGEGEGYGPGRGECGDEAGGHGDTDGAFRARCRGRVGGGGHGDPWC